MKKFFTFIVFAFFLSIPLFAQGDQEKTNLLWDFVKSNYEYLSICLIWIVNRLAPTKWKDPIVSILNLLGKIVPDRKKGGGSHNENKI